MMLRPTPKTMMLWFFMSVVYPLMLTAVPTNRTNVEEELNSLPETLRQSASTLLRIVNTSSAIELQEWATSNVTATVSNISLSDIESDSLTHALQLKYRERKKQERITLIRNQILSRLHISRQPNISASVFSEDEQQKIALFVERLQKQQEGIQFNTMQWMQSFYPSCSLPNSTDKSSWEQPGTFRIMFDIPFGKYSQSMSIAVAKLRLYKISGNDDPNFVGWDSNRPRYNILESLVNSRIANSINVNIYQYFKPLRTNKREKKRLVDSRSISVDATGWLEFNVITSLNYWFRHDNKNYGFDVEVEDAYGNKLDPNFYFQNRNCSSEIQVIDPPFPNILDMYRDALDKNDTSPFDNDTYPTLDLRLVEVPRDLEQFDMLEDGTVDRSLKKRSAQDSCRKELEYVPFADIGLDEYIVWPRGVLWTFCDGGCTPAPNATHNREYFYSSWFQRLFKIQQKLSSSDCVVTRRESLPVILYEEENQLSETVLEDFVPINCGCRAS